MEHKLNMEEPDIPESVAEAVKGNDRVMKVPYDIDRNGRFTQGCILFDGKRLWSVEDGEVVHEISLEDASDFKATSLIGSGIFEANVGGSPILLARFSLEYLYRFHRLERWLNEILAEGEAVVEEDDGSAICRKCGRPYPSGSMICPYCMDKWQALRKLFRAMYPYIKLLVLSTAIFWAVTGLRLLSPQLYRIMIDDIIRPMNDEPGRFILLILLIGLVTILTNLLQIARGRIMVKLGTGLSKDLRQMVFNRIQLLSLNYITRSKPGDLLNRITYDTQTIQRFLERQAAIFINEILVFIGVVVILFASDWRLAVLTVLPAPIVLFIAYNIRSGISFRYRRQWRIMDNVNTLLQDILSGIRVVKIFGQEKRESERFGRFSEEFRAITESNEKAWNTLFPLLGFLMGIGQFIILYYGGRLVLGERMLLGELVQFSTYASMLYGPLQSLSFIPRWFTEAMTATERIFQVIEEEPSVREAEQPVHKRIEGDVELKGLSFGYESHAPVLHNVELKVKKGEIIGLVGHSGAGKSTLINLLCRFYDPDRGAIYIDGIDLRDYSMQSLHSQLGVVLQETFLFSGSILDNIRYAKPDATMEEVIKASVIANAHDFIVKFPDGYDTWVGERGQRLSGGERQRIAIARAILHNPRILILDEATASVDSETEVQIQQAMARLMKDRTTFVIAHRLSTLRNADRILVLDHGKRMELGTHEELMKKRGIYYNLVMAQIKLSKIRGVDG